MPLTGTRIVPSFHPAAQSGARVVSRKCRGGLEHHRHREIGAEAESRLVRVPAPVEHRQDRETRGPRSHRPRSAPGTGRWTPAPERVPVPRACGGRSTRPESPGPPGIGPGRRPGRRGRRGSRRGARGPRCGPARSRGRSSALSWAAPGIAQRELSGGQGLETRGGVRADGTGPGARGAGPPRRRLEPGSRRELWMSGSRSGGTALGGLDAGDGVAGQVVEPTVLGGSAGPRPRTRPARRRARARPRERWCPRQRSRREPRPASTAGSRGSGTVRGAGRRGAGCAARCRSPGSTPGSSGRRPLPPHAGRRRPSRCGGSPAPCSSRAG